MDSVVRSVIVFFWRDADFVSNMRLGASRPGSVAVGIDSNESGGVRVGESFCSADRIIQWGREGSVILLCCAAESWSDNAWMEFLNSSLEMESRHGVARVTFCYFPRGTPTAPQRRMSVETTKKSKLAARIALLSDSALTRGAVTAIQWAFGRKAMNKAFLPNEIRTALQWLSEAAPFDVSAAETRATELVHAAHAAAGSPLPS